MLEGLSPRLTEDRWVFCVVPQVPPGLDCAPLMTFQEREGLTLIIPRAAADSLGLKGSGVHRQIVAEADAQRALELLRSLSANASANR